MKPDFHHGKWRIRWTEDGRRKSALYATQEEAQAALAAKRGLVLVPEPSAPLRTFDEVCEWYVRDITPRLKHGDITAGRIKNHLRPFFGDMALDNIKPADVEAFKAQWRLSNATLHRCTSLLGTMLKRAREDQEWTDRVVKIRHPKYQSAEMKYLETAQEIRALLVAARTFRLRGKRPRMLETLFATAVYTGMRLGELCGLEWSNVRLHTRQLDVVWQYDRLELKGKQRRTVPIMRSLEPLLSLWSRERPHDTIVFPNQRGGRLRKNSKVFDEYFDAALAKAHLEFRALRFHDLRHTYASMFMRNGGSLFHLQNYLGHRDVKTTQRYAHFSPTQYLDDLDRF